MMFMLFVHGFSMSSSLIYILSLWSQLWIDSVLPLSWQQIWVFFTVSKQNQFSIFLFLSKINCTIITVISNIYCKIHRAIWYTVCSHLRKEMFCSTVIKNTQAGDGSLFCTLTQCVLWLRNYGQCSWTIWSKIILSMFPLETGNHNYSTAK